MTAHTHRSAFHPFSREPHTRSSPSASEAVGHAPEVLLALAAVLVVLAGPVARTFAPHTAWVAVGSALLLAAGIALAMLATWHLLHAPAD